MKTVTLIAQPVDKKRGLTVDEIGSLVQQAHREDVPGDAPITVSVGWHGQITKAEIRGEGDQ